MGRMGKMGKMGKMGWMVKASPHGFPLARE
jgi:hypothetical protein